MPSTCPLCLTKSESPKLFYKTQRDFLECEVCGLVYVATKDLVEPDEEKLRYDTHNNHILTEGYKKFLYNVINPIKKYVAVDENQYGLDFGSGPYPMMAKLLNAEGYELDSYDPFFKPIELKTKYDFVVLCEVIEHFHAPHKDIEKITNLLDKDGYLFIQTSLLLDSVDFKSWYYKNDITHVSFFTLKAVEYILSEFNYRQVLQSGSVVVLQKL